MRGCLKKFGTSVCLATLGLSFAYSGTISNLLTANAEVATDYTGDQVLEYAKSTYGNQSYQEVDTCTGLVSHVLYYDLKIPAAMNIAGPRVYVGTYAEPYNGYLTQNNPDEMLDIAYKEAEKGTVEIVYEGPASGALEAGARNGDLVISRNYEVGAYYGHVAFFYQDGDDFGWWGAQNDKDGVSALSLKDSSTPIHVIRFTDYQKVNPVADLGNEQSAEIGIQITKKDKDGNGVKDMSFTILKDGKEYKKVKTNEVGVAQGTYSKEFKIDEKDYSYVTNYDNLSSEDKKSLDKQGVYHSKEEAQSAIDNFLYEKIKDDEDFKISSFSVIDDFTGIEYKLEDGKLVSSDEDPDYDITLDIDDASVKKKDVVLNASVGETFNILDEDGNIVNEIQVSSKEGSNIIHRLEVGKTYTLEPKATVKGMTKSDSITFEVADDLQEVSSTAKQLYNTVTATSTGKVLSSKGDKPEWVDGTVGGSTIGIYADKNIYENGVVKYTAGSKVTTLVADGYTTVELPYGEYSYVEETTQNGYVLNQTKGYFSIGKESTNITYSKEKVNVNLKTTKFKDGSTVDIYTKQDIKTNDGSVIYASGDKVMTTKVEDGNIKDSNLLPMGEYEVKAGKKSENYLVETTNIEKGTGITLTSEDEKNQKGNLEVKLVNQDDSSVVLKDIDLKLSVNEDCSDTINIGRTDEKGIAKFSNIKPGTYYLSAISELEGYTDVKSQKIEIVDGVDTISVDLPISPTKVEISILDKTGVHQLEGAKMQVIDDATGEIVDEFTTEKDTHLVKYLNNGGKYILRNVEMPENYEKLEDKVFTVEDGLLVSYKAEEIQEVKTGVHDKYMSQNIVGIALISQLAVFGVMLKKSGKLEELLNKVKF